MEEKVNGSTPLTEVDPPTSILEKYNRVFGGVEEHYFVLGTDTGITKEGKKEVKYNAIKHRRITDQDFLDHHYGNTRLVVSLIRNDDNKCKHAVLDVDHKINGQYQKVDCGELARTLNYMGIKACVFESKSGGGHVWFNFYKWQSAKRIRKIMEAVRYGLSWFKGITEQTEIFPKQEQINLENKDYPSCVSLPHFGKINCYFSKEGKPCDFKAGVVAMERDVLNETEISNLMLLGRTRKEDGRNNVLWSVCRYFYKTDPSNWEVKTKDINRLYFPIHQPAISEEEVERTILRSFRKSGDKYCSFIDENKIPNRNEVDTKEYEETEFFKQKQKEEPKGGRKIFDDNSFMERDIPKRKWVFGNVALKKCLTAFIGAGGTAKTQMAMNMAVAVANDIQFGLNKVYESGNTFIYCSEETGDELKRRISAIKRSMGVAGNYSGKEIHHKDIAIQSVRINASGKNNDMVKLKKRKHKVLMYSGLDNTKLVLAKKTKGGELFLTKDYYWLEEYLKENKIILAVLDPVVSLHEGLVENEASDYEFLAKALMSMASRCNTAIHVNSHTNKTKLIQSSELEDRMHSSRGSTAFTNACRVIKTIRTMAENDCAQYDVQKDDRERYLALSDAKNNYSRQNIDPYWFEKGEIEIESTEKLLVLRETSLHLRKLSIKERKKKKRLESSIRLAPIIKSIIEKSSDQSQENRVKLHWLGNNIHDFIEIGEYFERDDLSVDTLKREIQKMFSKKVRVGETDVAIKFLHAEFGNTTKWIEKVPFKTAVELKEEEEIPF